MTNPFTPDFMSYNENEPVLMTDFMSYNENEPVLMTASELADYLGVGKNRALIQPGLSFHFLIIFFFAVS